MSKNISPKLANDANINGIYDSISIERLDAIQDVTANIAETFIYHENTLQYIEENLSYIDMFLHKHINNTEDQKLQEILENIRDILYAKKEHIDEALTDFILTYKNMSIDDRLQKSKDIKKHIHILQTQISEYMPTIYGYLNSDDIASDRIL